MNDYPFQSIDLLTTNSVVVADESLKAFNELKLGKKAKFILFELNAAKTEIVVKETSTSTDYDDFIAKLSEDEALYAVYDFEYDIGANEGKRSKIVFYTWIPDTAPIKSKMIYAASKDALRRSLNGIAAEVQGTDFDEVAYETVLASVKSGAGNH